MFKEAIKSVEDARSSLALSEKWLLEARRIRTLLNSELENARRRLKRKKESSYPNNLAKQIIAAMKKDANVISGFLIDAIDKAAVGTEFEEPDTYKKYMYKAAKEPDIYNITTIGAGWNTSISPSIEFQAEAGSLSDYARGIIAFRKELKTKIGPEGSDRGLKATNWWYSNVFGTSLQSRTLEHRRIASGKIAPWWQLLNSGSVGMSSDRPDESYNPIPQSPTDFIGDAEMALKVEFDSVFSIQREQWLSEAALLEKEINYATEIRNEITDDIKKVSINPTVMERLLQGLGSKAQYVDKAKLASAYRKYRAGEEFETKTINLAKSGTGKQVRLTIKQVEGLLEL
jgi:hypothetical protein